MYNINTNTLLFYYKLLFVALGRRNLSSNSKGGLSIPYNDRAYIVHGSSQESHLEIGSNTNNAVSSRDNGISWDHRLQVSNGGSLDQRHSFLSPQTHSTLHKGVNMSMSERWSSGFEFPSSPSSDNSIASLITSNNGSKDDAIGMYEY